MAFNIAIIKKKNGIHRLEWITTIFIQNNKLI